MHKDILWETFGKVVSTLILGVNFDTLDVVLRFIDVGPEEVKLDTPVFGSTCDFLIESKWKSSVIIFMNKGPELE